MTNILGEVLQFTEEEHKQMSTKTPINNREYLYSKDEYADNLTIKPELSGMHRSLIKEINLNQAKLLIKENNTAIVWLGIEPIIYISKLIGVSHHQIKSINLHDIERYNNDQVLGLEGAVILSYDGIMSAHFSEFLKDKYGILTYVLKGGLYAIKETRKMSEYGTSSE